MLHRPDDRFVLAPEKSGGKISLWFSDVTVESALRKRRLLVWLRQYFSLLLLAESAIQKPRNLQLPETGASIPVAESRITHRIATRKNFIIGRFSRDAANVKAFMQVWK